MTKMICFDMDGTIADLYGVDNWQAKLEASDPSPYREAAPLCNMQILNSVLHLLIAQGWEVRVISWLSKNATPEYNTAVREAKREWLARHEFPCTVAHLVSYGATKADSVRKRADVAILVDDDAKVRAGWHLGETINPKTQDIIERLMEIARGF